MAEKMITIMNYKGERTFHVTTGFDKSDQTKRITGILKPGESIDVPESEAVYLIGGKDPKGVTHHGYYELIDASKFVPKSKLDQNMKAEIERLQKENAELKAKHSSTAQVK